MIVKIKSKYFEIKKLPEFAKYFDPKIWRTWRQFTYYRIFRNYFFIIDRQG